MKFSGVTILQGVEFSIFPIDFEWALQQCSATALPVIDVLPVRYRLCLRLHMAKLDGCIVWNATIQYLARSGPLYVHKMFTSCIRHLSCA